MGKDIRHITPVTLGAIVCILLFLSAVTPGCMAPKDTTGTPASPQASILVYAGAGLKAPMEEIAKSLPGNTASESSTPMQGAASSSPR